MGIGVGMKTAIVSLAAAVAATAQAGSPEYVRTESRAPAPGVRTRVFPRTWVFAELECYGPHQNMMHRFTDRCLFMDTRDRRPDTWTFADFRRDTAICRDKCGYDGLGSLDYFGSHLAQLRDFESNPPPDGYSQMIVIPGYWNIGDPASYGRLKHMVVEAAKSKYTTRFGGKLVMWCYGGGRDGEDQREVARKLRSDADMPPFMFIAEMPFMDIHGAYGRYEERRKDPEPIPPEVVEAYREKLANYVKDVDGVNVWLTKIEHDHLGEYPTHLRKNDIFRKYLLPVALEVMGRPENRGKLVGTWLRQGYVNPFTGVTDGEYGTETLRNYLDSALLLRPDMFMCFEWNEANENTHFQPTLAHGRTFARVINYYRSLIDRAPPRPMPGDDESVPNLVVSVRQAIKLGEPWHCELLYLPDGAAERSFSATLSLKGGDGRVIRRFPADTFRTDELLAVDYRISSEDLAGESSLAVELETVYRGRRTVWNGFDSTRIRATVCKDYLYSHMPLREQLVPARAPVFRAVANADGTCSVAGEFEAGEPLSSLEVVDDLAEVASAPSADYVYDRGKYAIFRGRFTTFLGRLIGKGPSARRMGRAWFEGSTGGVLRSAFSPWNSVTAAPGPGNAFSVGINLCGNASFYALVPKEDVEKSKLVFDLKGYGRVEAPLGEAWRRGKFAQSLPQTVRLDIEREEQLPDYPSPLEANSAKVSATLRSLYRFPAYQLRAVSMSGKVWRGALVHPVAHGGERREIEVWSDLRHEAAKAEVFADAIPDMKYVFSPVYGSWLRNTWERQFDAMLGGGGLYGQPMTRAEEHGKLATGFERPDPVWTNFEGRTVLRFEKGSFLQFAQGVMPRGAPYTIAFEIRPDDASDQSLIRTAGSANREAQLALTVKDGTVHLTPYGVSYYLYPDFDTKCRIKPGEWNLIVVSRDFGKFVLMVNGERREFPYDRRGRLYEGFAFAGNVAPGKNIPEGIRPFTGFLRAFRVRHLPLPPAH